MPYTSDFGFSIAGQLPAANQERRCGAFHADRAFIERFKRPCHGLPDRMHDLEARFDERGDLVDIIAVDEDGLALNTEEFDGPALVALVEDIQHYGEPVQ